MCYGTLLWALSISGQNLPVQWKELTGRISERSSKQPG